MHFDPTFYVPSFISKLYSDPPPQETCVHVHTQVHAHMHAQKGLMFIIKTHLANILFPHGALLSVQMIHENLKKIFLTKKKCINKEQ